MTFWEDIFNYAKEKSQGLKEKVKEKVERGIFQERKMLQWNGK